METAQPPLVQEPPSDEQAAQQEHAAAETHTPDRLFKLSEYVHVGAGAAECEEREEGTCTNPHHFHAWCRLPNQFQHEDIREKALAAKARRIRVLRDPDSDGHAIVEFALDELRATGDKDAMIEEIVAKDRLKHHLSAVQSIKEDEAFEHIEHDRSRLDALEAMEAETRPAEEYEHLRKHVAAFEEQVIAKVTEIEAPIREGLAANEIEALIDMIREDRYEKDAARVFMDVYNRWEWFIGTMKPQSKDKPGFPSDRYFKTLEHMESAAEEVLGALDETFAALEAELSAKGKAS